MNKKSRKLVPAIVAIAVAGTVSVAAAATLGGLNADQLGADDAAVTACDTDGIAVAYTTDYVPSSKEYEVDTVDLSGIAAGCVGQTLDITVADSSGAVLADSSLTVAGATASVSMPAGIAAADVEHVAVVIAG